MATFPLAISNALRFIAPLELPDRVSEGLECEGAKFHSPNPLVLHDVDLGDRTVKLCGTCRANVGILRRLLDHHHGDLPWPVKREFGNRLRALVIPKETDG